MKKILPILFLMFIIGCEDEKDESDGWKGTYKLSKNSMDCEGAEDVWYFTLETLQIEGYDKIKLTNWDYMGDECDESGDCYDNYTQTFTAAEDDTYKITDGSMTLTIEKSGDGIKMTYGLGSVSEFQIWDKESNDIKTYSPVCD